MFGKLMSIPDTLMENYFTLLTDVPQDDIRRTLRETHPREAKERLARAVAARYWGDAAADAAAEEFRRVFSEKEKPADIPEAAIPAAELTDGRAGLARLIVLAGMASSNGEAMRLIRQGAVRLDDEVQADPQATVAVKEGVVLRVGKRRWGRLAVR
jgi:tyrosyl-tRNA synthetase